jgi:hypothetical protein
MLVATLASVWNLPTWAAISKNVPTKLKIPNEKWKIVNTYMSVD